MTHILALCGGVGGAKLVLGLTQCLAPEDLTIVVNTGDDFEHLGLSISPDIDTVLYTLAGLSNPEQGWGRAGETWNFMQAVAQLGGETWFRLGDNDLALHVERTRRLAAGETLSEITASFAQSLGVLHNIVPMTDDPVRTQVHCNIGTLSFQHYFVREQCAPKARGISFDGSDKARPSHGFTKALEHPGLGAIIYCPSNPYLSIDPILSLAATRKALARTGVPRIAVSPIVGGKAVKGPTAKLMQELGFPIDQVSIAAHYSGLIDVLVVDQTDTASRDLVRSTGIDCIASQTIMHDRESKIRLARSMLEIAAQFREARSRIRA